jgi:hypothetical protein
MVIGLDLSPTSLEHAEQVILAEVIDAGKEPIKTPIALVCGDFFETKSWETIFCSNSTATSSRHQDSSSLVPPTIAKRLDKDDKQNLPAHFDFIYDYTFFSALPPSLREAWGKQMRQFLKPGTGGRLLTLIFPILPPPDDSIMKGPPYPVTVDDYRSVLQPHGIVMDGDGPFESPETVRSRRGKELVCYWRIEGRGNNQEPNS